MKLVTICWIVGALLVAAGAFTATAVFRQNRAGNAHLQRFTVLGEVRGIDGQELRIKHEAIPGYMPAMTMPFSVRDAALLRDVGVGDRIRFELVVSDTDSWLSRIEKLKGARDPEQETVRGRDERPKAVESGQRIPDFSLIDQNGRTVRLSDFRGKAVVLTFIYTRCPLPNFCPLMSRNFASLQERLAKDFAGRYQLISVSIDPLYDTPEVLREYAARYTTSNGSWTFGTGTAEQADAVGAMFGLVQERAGGLINHDLRTALIAPDGRLVHVWKSNVWTPYEVQRRVAEALGQPMR